jgi:hypothetical protein
MKKSTKIILIIIIVVCAALIIINNFIISDREVILAKVNGESITSADIDRLEQEYGIKLTEEERILVLQDLINEKILKIYAEKEGAFDNPEYIKEFEWQKNEVKKSLLSTIFIQEELGKTERLTDEDYENYLTENPQVKIKTIFVPIEEGDSAKAKEQIDEAYTELEQGKEFEKVMKKFTPDEYLPSGEEPELADHKTVQKLIGANILDLPIASYTLPISTPYGFYIFKRYPDPTLDEIKEKLGDKLEGQKQGSYVNAYIDSLTANITVYSDKLQEAISSGNPEKYADEIVATLNGCTLTYDTVYKYLLQIYPPQRFGEIDMKNLNNLVQQLILQEFLYMAAIDSQVDTSPSFLTQWEAQGEQLEMNWENFVINRIYDDEILPDIEPTDEEIEEYYSTHRGEFQEGGRIKPLTSVKNQIAFTLRNEKFAQWVDNTKNKYKITVKIYDENL